MALVHRSNKTKFLGGRFGTVQGEVTFGESAPREGICRISIGSGSLAKQSFSFIPGTSGVIGQLP
jgi:hypothetical protein